MALDRYQYFIFAHYNVFRTNGQNLTTFCIWVDYLMPRLHLPYDEYTMLVRCPNHRFRAASAGRPCDHRTDLCASWPLRFCLTPHNDKFEKIVSP